MMLAFTFEAKINFLGHRLLGNWEKQNLDDKMTQVLKHLGVAADWKIRPDGWNVALPPIATNLCIAVK